MTDDQSAVEAVARAVHEHLCQRNIMQYLDNEEDCEGIARAAIAAGMTPKQISVEAVAKHLRLNDPDRDDNFDYTSLARASIAAYEAVAGTMPLALTAAALRVLAEQDEE